LRAACRAAIRRAADGADRVVLLAADPRTRVFDARSRGSLRGVGVALDVALGPGRPEGPADLPTALTVGAWLVRDALGPDVRMTATTVASSPDTPARRLDDTDLPVVVLGDGSARRTLKAPGYLDERAAAFDAGVEQALRTGDAAALAALDARLGADLLAAGVPAWRAVGPVLAERNWNASLGYAGDPYGVMYFAASWVSTPAPARA
ncbi:hypothetical protein, partial [Jatrophihabitans endophyticus]|uniref:hypothetical protein n=1 Tax=Jatrophihabitans endophyticus TaxID=1206085 RepID=UPI0019E12415